MDDFRHYRKLRIGYVQHLVSSTLAMPPLPSPQTKHQNLIEYPLSTSINLQLSQSQQNSFSTTGTTLWLSAQVLSAYLLDTYSSGKQGKPKRCIELGSGVGLVGLTLASLSFDVVMTDIPFVLQSVLLPNIRRNKPLLSSFATFSDPSPASMQAFNGTSSGGSIVGRELDWTVSPADWDWSRNPSSVTSEWVDPSYVTPISSNSNPALAGPPFDLILTTDTIYLPSLLPHLLNTLKTLSSLSDHPPILLALERRDPALVDKSLDEFMKAGFEAKMVNKGRLKKSVDRHLGWAKSDWDDVEVWKFRYKKAE